MFVRLKEILGRPVAWGFVILSYIGIFAGFFFAMFVYDQNKEALRAESAARVAEAKAQADAQRGAIVSSGRVAIKSSCYFDNQRAREIRGLLKRSIANQRAFIAQGAIPPALGQANIAFNQEGIRSISLRDCEKAAAVLTADPKESP